MEGRSKQLLTTLSPLHLYLILLLGAKSREPIPGKLWLQKQVFLLAQHIDKLQKEVGFEPYRMGPYSENVDAALSQLVMLGLVKQEPGKGLSLTRDGEDLYSLAANIARRETLELIEEVKDQLNDLSSDELLAYIYSTYPDMTKESEKLREIQAKKLELAVKLYVEEKVSLQKAAQIAGLKLEAFINELRKRGVSVPLSP